MPKVFLLCLSIFLQKLPVSFCYVGILTRKPTYQNPFIQQRVIEDFQEQILKYQSIAPNIVLQFSQQPPEWIIEAIEEAGGHYIVRP